MKKNNYILNSIAEIEPPKKMKEAVLGCIYEARTQDARRKRASFQFGFAFFGVSILLAVSFLGKEIASSQFWNIASLAFSDAGVVILNWQTFGISLLETIPTAAMLSMLTPTFFLLILIKKYAQQEAFKQSII